MGSRRLESLGLALLAALALGAASAAWADQARPGFRQIHTPRMQQGHVHPHGHFHGHRHFHGHPHFHRGARVGIGIQLAPSVLYPSYPYYPYYPYPAYVYGPMAVPASPDYVERTDADAGVTPQPAYWYRCADPEGYYPYVAACPGGWQQVPAEPPATVR